MSPVIANISDLDHRVPRKLSFNLKTPLLHHWIVRRRREELDEVGKQRSVLRGRNTRSHGGNSEAGFVAGRTQLERGALPGKWCTLIREHAAVPTVQLVPS